jgi:hypothetical protein
MRDTKHMNEAQEHPEPGAWELLAKYLRRPGVLLPLLGLVTFGFTAARCLSILCGMTGRRL